MDLPPFLLEEWLAKHGFGPRPISCDLASSTGPGWRLDEILCLGEGLGPLGDTALGYGPPEGSGALREAIAGFHGVDPDWVVVTTGASEALSLLLCVLGEPGAELVIPDPGYPAYAAMARAWRLEPRTYALDREHGYAQRAEAVLGTMKEHTAAVIVNTPHNPTGSVMRRSEVRELAERLGGRGVLLIVDEVYHPLYFGPAERSAAGLPNTIVISDMSKALSLPGLRLGWIIDGDGVRRARILNARGYFTISCSPLLERIAAHALGNADAILDRLRLVASRNLILLDSMIGQSAGTLRWSRPEGGTTAFPWMGSGKDSRPLCEALAGRGVLVAPGDCFGHPEHFRLNLAGPAEGFEEALASLAAALDRNI